MRFVTGDIVKFKPVPPEDLEPGEEQDETEYTVLRTEHVWRAYNRDPEYLQRLNVGTIGEDGEVDNVCTGFRNGAFDLVRRVEGE